jgi:hypothetical protein
VAVLAEIESPRKKWQKKKEPHTGKTPSLHPAPAAPAASEQAWQPKKNGGFLIAINNKFHGFYSKQGCFLSKLGFFMRKVEG